MEEGAASRVSQPSTHTCRWSPYCTGISSTAGSTGILGRGEERERGEGVEVERREGDVRERGEGVVREKWESAEVERGELGVRDM